MEKNFANGFESLVGKNYTNLAEDVLNNNFF